MVKYKTSIHQFGIISGIRQDTSDRLTVTSPGNLFTPEARKGQLLIMTETADDLVRGREACTLVSETISKSFYEDSSFSVTSSLRKALLEANSALYQHNFRAAHHQRTAVGVSCAVLKGGDLYLAQVQPTQAYIAHGGKLRALPPHLSWNPASSITPILPPNALGTSLFTEPDLRRSPLGPGDTLVFCSTNVARLLGKDEAERLFCYGDPASALETLYMLCKRSSLPEAYAVIVEMQPLLSTDAGVGERGKIAAQAVGGWIAGLTGEAALLLRRNPQQGEEKEPVEEQRGGEPQRLEEPVLEQQEPIAVAVADPVPETTASGLLHHEPFEEEQLPMTAFLGEVRHRQAPKAVERPPIDLGDQVPLPVDFAAIPKKQQMPPPTIGERLTLPFRVLLGLIVTFMALLLRQGRRPAARELPRFSKDGSLSYRRQRRPIPWLQIFLFAGIIGTAVFYARAKLLENQHKSIESALRTAEVALRDAETAPTDDQALQRLDEVRASLAQASSNNITTTSTLWGKYVSLRDRANELTASITRLNLFGDIEVVATLPTTDTVGKIAVNPETGDMYVLGANSRIIYRVAADSRRPEPFFQEGARAQQITASQPQSFVWRIDAIAPFDRRSEGGPFTVYLYNQDDPSNWFFNALQGSETWQDATPDIESFGGNLYIWGGEPGQVLKYSSGQYANLPEKWVTDAGGTDLAPAIDMVVDGQIYLLFPNGEVAVLAQGRLDRTLPAPKIEPAALSFLSIFASGDSPETGKLYLLDPREERIIERSKSTGEVIQQLKSPPNGPRLTDLRDIFVIEQPNKKPTIYLANGNQILRATIPDPIPPRTLPATPETPAPTPTP